MSSVARFQYAGETLQLKLCRRDLLRPQVSPHRHPPRFSPDSMPIHTISKQSTAL